MPRDPLESRGKIASTLIGRTRTVFRAGLIGVVHVIARVDNTTQQKAIAISHRGDTSD